MLRTTMRAGVGVLGTLIAIGACSSPASTVSPGAAGDPLLGSAGHAPKADGTCNAGLTACAGLCQTTCAAPADAGSGPTSDAALPIDASDAGSPNDAGPPLPESGVIATGVRKVFSIAVDADAVYWAEDVASSRAKATDPKTGKITKLSLHGGAPVDLATGEDAPVSIALDGADVYWGTSGVEQTVPGGVYKVPAAGGAKTTLVTAAAGVDQIVIAGGSLYWFVLDFQIASANGGIWKGNLDGSQAQLVMSNPSFFSQFVVQGGETYMMSSAGLLSSSAAGGNAPFPNGNFGSAAATDGTALYFVSGAGALEKAPLPFSAAQGVTVVDPGPGGVSVPWYSTMAVDGASAYWAACTKSPASCTLYKEPLAGGGATAIGTHDGTQGCVAVSATHVYWGVDGAILRFSK